MINGPLPENRSAGSPVRPDAAERFTGICILLGVAACIYLVPYHFLETEICPFKLLSGTPCPLCGMTRSIYHTARGNFSAAWSYHPAGIFFFFTLISAFPVLLFSPLYRNIQYRNAESGILKHAALGAAAGILLCWILRLFPQH